MKQKQYQKMNWAEIESIIYSDCDHPFEILGPHKIGKETLLQAFFPYAQSVKVCFDDKDAEVIEMEEVEEEGFFAVFFSNKKKLQYHYEVLLNSGEKKIVKDPYAFKLPSLKKELVSFFKGTMDCANDLFGAKETVIDGIKGVVFNVYAPNAVRVSVIGPFNNFDGRMNPMEKDDSTGVFSLFVPQLCAGEQYCYEIKKKNADVLVRRDPYALAYGNSHPAACTILSQSAYKWKDNVWMSERKLWSEKVQNINIFHIDIAEMESLFKKGFNASCKKFLLYLRKMNYTHVDLSGIWDKVGHKNFPVKGFFALNNVCTSADNLKKFIEFCHINNIAVITDFTISYFANDEFGLPYFDGTHLYEHADARKGYHSRFDACLFQYKTPHVKSLLYTSLRFLLEEYHFDGIRWCDVASMLYLDYGKSDGEWICNEQGGNCNFEAVSLIREMNSYMEAFDKGLVSVASIDAVWSQVTKTAGEESLGFDYVENHGITESLIAFLGADIYQKRSAYYDIIRQSKFAFSEGFILPDTWSASYIFDAFSEHKEAVLALYYTLLTFYPGKKMQLNDRNYSEELCEQISSVNKIYATMPLLYDNDLSDDSLVFMEPMSAPASIISYVRKGMNDELLLIVGNVSAESTQPFRLGVPLEGKYKPIFTNDKNCSASWITSEEQICDKQKYSFMIELPAWGFTVFSYRPFTQKEAEEIAQQKKKSMLAQLKAERLRIEKERDALIAKVMKDASVLIAEIEKKQKELE